MIKNFHFNKKTIQVKNKILNMKKAITYGSQKIDNNDIEALKNSLSKNFLQKTRIHEID